MKLNEDQLEAKDRIVEFINSNNKYFILIGSAGTGKTTLITEIFKEERYKNLKIAFSATTNKAVSVLELMDNINNKNFSYITIHKLLNIKRNIMDDGTIKYNKMLKIFNKKYNSICNYKIIIIDEASLISNYLLNELEKQVKGLHIKIIFVGDENQLPPINEVKSLVFSRNYSLYRLKIIERSKNDIVKYSNSIIDNNKLKYRELGDEIKFYNKEVDWLENYRLEDIMLAYTNDRCNYINKFYPK